MPQTSEKLRLQIIKLNLQAFSVCQDSKGTNVHKSTVSVLSFGTMPEDKFITMKVPVSQNSEPKNGKNCDSSFKRRFMNKKNSQQFDLCITYISKISIKYDL